MEMVLQQFGLPDEAVLLFGSERVDVSRFYHVRSQMRFLPANDQGNPAAAKNL